MAAIKADCQIVRIDEGTPGGNTYYIITPGKDDPRALCYRQIVKHPERVCTNSAGSETWHYGTGACYRHGGAVPENVHLVTGKYSKMRGRLAERVQEYLKQDRSQLLDLTSELAVTKAVYDEFIENHPDFVTQEDEIGVWLHRFQAITGTLGNLVEKISRVDNRNTLTTAQVMYLKAVVLDVILKYIVDPSARERIAKELASRLGGDTKIALKPYEFSKPDLDM